MATLQQWATFFTGKYALLADAQPVAQAELRFSTGGANDLLRCSIQSAGWNDTGDFFFRLKTGNAPGHGQIPGGHMKGTMSHANYGGLVFVLQAWELVQQSDGSWAVGFSPTGKDVAIRFDGRCPPPQSHALQFNSAWRRQRPDKNYPWNLP